MPQENEILYRSRENIVQQMIGDFQDLVADIYLGEDGNLRMILEVMGGPMESIFLAVQLLSEDMFIRTANIPALLNYGEQYGVAQKTGSVATGALLFSGAGGTYINIGAMVAHDPQTGIEPLYFQTTEDGTIPDPGIPDPPTVAEGASGVLDGLYEYVVTFLTAAGETSQGGTSEALSVSSKKIELSDIPLGGPGTTGRKIYRAVDGGDFKLVTTLTNNTVQTFEDNTSEGSLGATPPTESTAERITLAAVSVLTGTRYNVVPGAISLTVDTPDGVADVTNPLGFSGGTDSETTDSYRLHLLQAVRGAGTGSPDDLKTWAEQVEGVESATVYPNDNEGTPTNGHTTIRISGPGGSVPDSDVIDAVEAVIAAKDFANITFHIATFIPDTTAVEVTITVNELYTLESVSPGVQAAIQNYVNNRAVGETVRVNGIIDAVFGLIGVDDVSVDVPTGNVTVAAAHKAVAGTITVNEA